MHTSRVHPVIRTSEPERCIDVLMDSLTRLGRPLSDLPRLGVVEYMDVLEPGVFVRNWTDGLSPTCHMGDPIALDAYVATTLRAADFEDDDYE